MKAKADAENQMRGFQAATTPEADTVSDELKSALKKAKADAENQKREGSDKAKSIEEERPRAQERAEQERLEAESQRKLAASKRVEWLGVGMLRAGFKEEQVIRTLTQGGTVVAWGDKPTVPAGLSSVVAIAAGGYHTVALKQDGTVVAWGNNGSGQTTVPAGLSGVVAMAAGYWHTVALKQDGTVVAWGDNSDGQTTVPAGLSGVVAIAAGDYHTVALKLE